MARLRTKKGCLTCLARKKKCDEAKPTCGNCERLGLDCVTRPEADEPSTQVSTKQTSKFIGQTSDISGSSRALQVLQKRVAALPPLRPAIANGFPPFSSDVEKKLVLDSSVVMQPFISCMASRDFLKVPIIGEFATQNSLVRSAVVAFSAYQQNATTNQAQSYKLCISSYQKCVQGLKSSLTSGNQPSEDVTLAAVLFLGLLEGLGLGDSTNVIAHFEVCRRLLISRLSRPKALEDAALVKFYRIAAECIIFNCATFSSFQPNVQSAVSDWGKHLDPLFPEEDHLSSPFFGGFREVYQTMLQINLLLMRLRSKKPKPPSGSEFEELWSQLENMEERIPSLFAREAGGTERAKMYRAKYWLHVLSLKIHILKIADPTTTVSDRSIRFEVGRALKVLAQQNIMEKHNPSLRWPLTIIACATETEREFRVMAAKICEMAQFVDPANARKLRGAVWILHRCQQERLKASRPDVLPSARPQARIDYLLVPWELDADVVCEPEFGELEASFQDTAYVDLTVEE